MPRKQHSKGSHCLLPETCNPDKRDGCICRCTGCQFMATRGSEAMEWADVTGYSRGERGTVEPRSWALDLDGLRVVVSRMHGVDGIWFGTCHAMGVDRHQLCAADLEMAKHEFLGYLESRAQRWVSKIGRAWWFAP